MYRWAIKHSAIPQSKSRIMKRTHNAVIDEFALCERAAKVGARLRHCKETISAPNYENGHIVMYGSNRLVVGQL